MRLKSNSGYISTEVKRLSGTLFTGNPRYFTQNCQERILQNAFHHFYFRFRLFKYPLNRIFLTKQGGLDKRGLTVVNIALEKEA